jgi:hypothetical protein
MAQFDNSVQVSSYYELWEPLFRDLAQNSGSAAGRYNETMSKDRTLSVKRKPCQRIFRLRILTSGSVVPVVALALSPVSTMAAIADDLRESKGKITDAASNSCHRVLSGGAMLLSPKEETVVDTPSGEVRVGGDALALLICFDRGLGVYDLLAKRSIEVESASESVSVLPGHCAVLTQLAGKSFEELNPCSFAYYRNLDWRSISGDIKLYQAEFDVMSVVNGLPPLQALLHSNDEGVRKKMDEMLKTAKERLVLSSSKEPFALYVAPQLNEQVSEPHPSSL